MKKRSKIAPVSTAPPLRSAFLTILAIVVIAAIYLAVSPKTGVQLSPADELGVGLLEDTILPVIFNYNDINGKSGKDWFCSMGKISYQDLQSNVYDESDFNGWIETFGQEGINFLLDKHCPAKVSTAALLAYYSFDDDTPKDNSGNGHDGTYKGNAKTTVNGKIGSALVLDGNGDYVNLGNLDLSGGAITIAMFIKPQNIGGCGPRLFSQAKSGSGNDHNVMLSFCGSFRYRQKTGSNLGSGTSTQLAGSPSLNTWQHVAIVYDGSKMRLYKDGKQAGTKSKSGTIPNAPWLTFIGANPPGNSYYNGLIDEVYIFKRTLSQEEIQALSDGPAPISEPAPEPEQYPKYNGIECTDSDSDSPNPLEVKGTVLVTNTSADGIFHDTYTDSCWTSIDRITEYSCIGFDVTHDYVDCSCSDGRCVTEEPPPAPEPEPPLVTNTSSLIAYYSFNDGTANDNSGNNHHGTLGGNAKPSFGKVGGGFTFDGSGDYINISSIAPQINPNEGTISTWTYFTSLDGNQCVLCIKGDIGFIRIMDESLFKFRYKSSGGETNTGISMSTFLNNWVLITATWDSNSVKLYIGGTKVNEKISRVSDIESFSVARIGTRESTPAVFFKGNLDEIRIYNKALTQTEIQALTS